MDKLPPIPSPPGTLWREFRIRFMPYLVFAIVGVATAYLWKGYVGPARLVGQVDQLRTVVSSHHGGRVVLLKVGEFQQVAKDQPIAQIMTTDPRVLEAQLAVNRARIDLVRADMDPRLRKENNAINFESLRLDWMQRRVDLATEKARIAYYENEFRRVELLFGGKPKESSGGSPEMIASIRDFDIAKRDLDSARARVSELERLVNDLAAALRELEPSDLRGDSELPGSVRAAIAVEEKELALIEAQLAPITITSPMEGVVSVIHRRDGENVVAGDPIVTLVSKKAERVMAYVRLPLSELPKEGQPVEIRSRNGKRNSAQTQIIKVSPALEPIRSELLPRSDGNTGNGGGGGGAREMGLPILIAVPPGLALLPGEIVDVLPVQSGFRW